MSELLFMASDAPFAERRNPHEKLLSINEALALGITDIPDFMLEEGFDRNQPNVILYMDREIEINPQTNEIEDGNFADDFAIFPFLPQEYFGIHTEKPFCANLEWNLYTKDRAENVIAYMREHLQKTEELEIWRVWLDDTQVPVFRKKELLLSELTEEVLQEIAEADLTIEPPVHYCYKIRRA